MKGEASFYNSNELISTAIFETAKHGGFSVFITLYREKNPFKWYFFLICIPIYF